MENYETKDGKFDKKSAHPIEHDYEKHKKNPGPAPTAINEDDDKGIGLTLIWTIALMFIILAIVWFFFFKDAN